MRGVWRLSSAPGLSSGVVQGHAAPMQATTKQGNLTLEHSTSGKGLSVWHGYSSGPLVLTTVIQLYRPIQAQEGVVMAEAAQPGSESGAVCNCSTECSVAGQPASHVYAALIIKTALYIASLYMPALAETCVRRMWICHVMCHVIVLLHALSVKTA